MASRETGLQNTVWDVVVIGGGPAGMMSAGRAAERGKRVLLLEKNPTLGKKLLITGGGRCNLTNNKQDIRTMLSKYKGNDQFLFSAFSQFAVRDTLAFFNQRGMPTKIEAEDRVFPVSNSAQSVWDVLNEYVRSERVTVRVNSAVSRIKHTPNAKQFEITLKSGEKIITRACVVATGGTSRPETGSTGDGFAWLKELGHTVTKNSLALVPIALKDTWVKKLGGVTLQNIKITSYLAGVKQESYKGKLLFTHFGISGPTVLNMSRDIGALLESGDVTLHLDLHPNLDPGALKEAITSVLSDESNKKLKNSLATLIPTPLVLPLLELAGVNGDTPCHSVRHSERIALITLLKSIPLHVQGLLGTEKAVVSSGGVSLEEVDFKTMQSRLIPGLFIVGDVLNIDRPSGGYSLQLCWTTGFVAGNSC